MVYCMFFGIPPNAHIQTNHYFVMSDSSPIKSQHPNVQGTDTVSQTAKQMDQQTDRQVVGQRCTGSEGEGPTWALLACPYPLLASPLPNAREQMGCTARPSVHQSYCTKQHTPQATTPTSVSRTELYQTRTSPPTQTTNTYTLISIGNLHPSYSIVNCKHVNLHTTKSSLSPGQLMCDIKIVAVIFNCVL